VGEYYQWVGTRHAPDAAFYFGAPKEVDPFLDDIWAGRKLSAAPQVFRLRIDPPFQGRPGDELTVLDHHCLLLSPRLVGVLRGAGVDGFETYPCEVTQPPAPGAHAYRLVLLRDIVYCVDHGKSKLELDVENPRVIEAIEMLAVDESRLDGSLLFRLGENRQIVIAHESVVRAVEEAGVTGVTFAPVDGSQEVAAPIDQVGGKWPQFVLDYVEKNA
jgi:hypothetical protein